MSYMTFRNKTGYIAQYVVTKGEQVVARIPGIPPNAQMQVPTDNTYQVEATAVIDGNTYITAPLDVSGATGFRAQVIQAPTQDTYAFEMVEIPSLNPGQLQFQKTCLGPVSFTILLNGRVLQSVQVVDDFSMKTLEISDTYSIYAIVNGITTDTISTTDPSAVITAITGDTTLDHGYFTLTVG